MCSYGCRSRVERRLEEDKVLPRKKRRTAQGLYRELVEEGYEGAYDSVRRYVRNWKESERYLSTKAYIPLSFEPGEAFQFDWSQEDVELGGVPQRVRVAQFTLCYSRMSFSVAFPRESQEMILEAHNLAFEFFGGSCARGIYDNMKTTVLKILRGKDREINLRFEKMCSHHLFEPVFCTPAAGWEKGRVERRILTARQRLFTPRLKFPDLAELNAHLVHASIADAKAREHPELPEKTVWEAFETEQAYLCGPFKPYEACTETEVSSSKTCLVRYDNNHYSVDATAAGRCVQLRAYAGRIVVLSRDKIVADHVRRFGRGHVVFDPWHYLSVLERKPGALRNGKPFKDWELPGALQEMRQRLEASRKDWDRQFVDILAAVPGHGLEAVERACAEALSLGACNATVVLNILHRALDEEEPKPELELDARYRLGHVPVADCRRYDALRGGADVTR